MVFVNNCSAAWPEDKPAFWMRRKRGFLNTEGSWTVENGADNMPYYCVQSGMESSYTVVINDGP